MHCIVCVVYAVVQFSLCVSRILFRCVYKMCYHIIIDGLLILPSEIVDSVSVFSYHYVIRR